MARRGAAFMPLHLYEWAAGLETPMGVNNSGAEAA
jgi:hypothetical protein